MDLFATGNFISTTEAGGGYAYGNSLTTGAVSGTSFSTPLVSCFWGRAQGLGGHFMPPSSAAGRAVLLSMMP